MCNGLARPPPALAINVGYTGVVVAGGVARTIPWAFRSASIHEAVFEAKAVNNACDDKLMRRM
jgi:hypothetical protein